MKKTVQLCVSAAVLAGLVVTVPCSAAGKNRGATKAAVEAAKLHETAVSAYSRRKWGEAEPLFEQFIQKFPTHEYVPLASIRLAYCRLRLKRLEGYVEALEGVTRRFRGSAYWFTAWGALLAKARAEENREKYFNTLEVMVRHMKVLPLFLTGQVPYEAWRYRLVEDPRVRYQYRSYASGSQNVYDYLAPMAEVPRGLVRGPGWIIGVVNMANTPELAERALKALAGTLKTEADDLPPGWQYAHVALLKRAGLEAQAQAAWDEYLAGWGDDPRAVSLWTIKYDHALVMKDDKAADAAMAKLVETYGRFRSLQKRFVDRVKLLYGQKRYEEVDKLARHCLATFPDSQYSATVIGLMMARARISADKGDPAIAKEVLKLSDALPTRANPAGERAKLRRRISLHVTLKNFEQAAKIAEELINDKNWSRASFDLIVNYAARHQAFKKVLAAARKNWDVPEADPKSEAAKMLADLRSRLKDEQTRHAEEIGNEMFDKHARDAATIEAVALLVDYYFRKVLPEPRDKWMTRMIEAYPHHPSTEKVLSQQIVAMRAARRYDLLAETLDKYRSRFPGSVGAGWFRDRLSCYSAAKDEEGTRRFVREFYGRRVDAGDGEALQEITRAEKAYFRSGDNNEADRDADMDGDNKAIGDAYMKLASKLAGTKAQLTCLQRAWRWYYYGPRYNPHYYGKVQWEDARRTAEQFVRQEVDPELRWVMAYADINMLARSGQGKQAKDALEKRLDPRKKVRDLTLRMDLPALGFALGKSKLGAQARQLIARLKRAVFTDIDNDAIEFMQARMHEGAESWGPAAKHYFNLVKSARWPAYRYGFLNSGANCWEKGRSGGYVAAMEAYIQKVKDCQEIVPPVLYRIGYYHLRRRSRGVMSIQARLRKQYPDSYSLSNLQQEIEKLAASMNK